MRRTLKTHTSICKLAASVAGVHIEVAKCVLVTTCISWMGTPILQLLIGSGLMYSSLLNLLFVLLGSTWVGIWVWIPLKGRLRNLFVNMLAQYMRLERVGLHLLPLSVDTVRDLFVFCHLCLNWLALLAGPHLENLDQ